MAIRALVVDDEEDMRVLATVFLEMNGEFQVTAVSSGQDALTSAALECPDVILLDYMMPEMDGPATLAALQAQEKTRGIPVVFLTAKSDAGIGERLLAAGAKGIIQKPFQPDALSEQLFGILRDTR